jgi:hypothetical protein
VKTVINPVDGNEKAVPEDTPVRVRNGVNYLLTAAEQKEFDDRQAQWAAKANERALEKVLQLRRKDYGSIETQLDMQYWDAVNGTTTWKDHISQVKNNHPKP